MAMQITCVCGYVFRADDEATLWTKAQEHLASAHPDMVGKVTREEILAQAELI
jgi:predicted small metal-binding protein